MINPGRNNGVLLQVKSLGVPVQAPSQRNQAGYEIRWSSDPEVSTSCPVHILIGDRELKKFLQVSVDPSYIKSDMLTVTHVTVAPGQNNLTKDECIAHGASKENWDLVRVGLVISGKTDRGPVMDTLDWIGSRTEFKDGYHKHAALKHASSRGISHATIHTHTDASNLLMAADFIRKIRIDMKPSLRTSELVRNLLEEAMVNEDVSQYTPEKAKHVLSEIQRAFVTSREQRLSELEDSGIKELTSRREAQDKLDDLAQPTPQHQQQDSTAYEHDEPDFEVRRPSGPKFH